MPIKNGAKNSNIIDNIITKNIPIP
jgi:hypothetical protein